MLPIRFLLSGHIQQVSDIIIGLLAGLINCLVIRSVPHRMRIRIGSSLVLIGVSEFLRIYQCILVLLGKVIQDS